MSQLWRVPYFDVSILCPIRIKKIGSLWLSHCRNTSKQDLLQASYKVDVFRRLIERRDSNFDYIIPSVSNLHHTISNERATGFIPIILLLRGIMFSWWGINCSYIPLVMLQQSWIRPQVDNTILLVFFPLWVIPFSSELDRDKLDFGRQIACRTIMVSSKLNKTLYFPIYFRNTLVLAVVSNMHLPALCIATSRLVKLPDLKVVVNTDCFSY